MLNEPASLNDRMWIMRKIIYATIVLGAMAAAATPAQAARHNFDGTITLAPIAETGNPPFSGNADYAGSVTSTLGRGALLAHNDYTYSPAFQGTFRIFFNKGTLRATTSGSGSAAPGGGIGITGAGQITKGTGKYKGAKGKFTFTGTEPPNSEITTFEVDGSVKY